jgi:hypothetical protein
MALDASVSLSEVYMVLIHGKSPRKSTWLCTPVIAAEKEKRGERGEKKERDRDRTTYKLPYHWLIPFPVSTRYISQHSLQLVCACD